MTATRRVVLLVVGVAGLATAAFLLPLQTVPAALARLGSMAPAVGVLVGAGLLVALVPRTPVSVACGLLFGAALGPVIAWAVMVVAATATFTGGRLLGRDFVVNVSRRLAGRRAGRSWDALDRWIAREGILAVAAVRSLPLAPYGLVGYAYGASVVRPRDYAVGTVLAGTPSAVTYALLGAALGAAGEASPLTLLPLSMGLVLTAAVAVRTRARLRAEARAAVAHEAHPGPPPPSMSRATGGTAPGR